MSEEIIENKGNDRALVLISAFLIAVTGFLLYSPSIGIPLHGEDQVRFVADTNLHRIVTWPDALAFWPEAPLTVFGYALNWAILPMEGAGLRLINILLHVLSGIFLYLVARKLLGKDFPEPLAMLPGLALIVHPLSTEGVVYLSMRPTLQATCFALVATAVFLHALVQKTPRPMWIAGALLLYVLAVASSFAVLGLPLIWLAFGRLNATGDSIVTRRILNVGALGLMVALFVARQATGAAGAITTPDGISQTLSAQAHTAVGLRHFFSGHDLLASYNALAGMDYLGMALLVGCLVLGLTTFLGINLGAPAWWALIALTSIPCLLDRSVAYSEAQLYFPLAGILLFYAVIPQKIPVPSIRYGVCAALAALLAFNAYQSYSRTIAWSDPLYFWGEAAQDHLEIIEPRLYQGRYLMGVANATGDAEQTRAVLAQATKVWEAAERVDPAHVEVLARHGETLFRLGETDAAIEKLEAALEANPFYPDISLLLALAYEKKVENPADVENLRAVAAHFARADRQEELTPSARARYGMALLTLGNPESALQQLHAAYTADPNLPYENTIGNIQRRLAEVQQLNEQAVKAFQENPDKIDGILLRARADILNGNFKRAFYILDRTSRKYPDNKDSWTLIGIALAGLNDTAGFIRDCPKVFEGDVQFWTSLAVECAGMSNWAAALLYLQHTEQWSGAGTMPPQLQLAGVALALQQLSVAQRFAEDATRLYPDLPEPWLFLAQIAVASENDAAARNYLKEAEQRGADAETLKAIQEQGSVDMNIPETPVRTIIR